LAGKVVDLAEKGKGILMIAKRLMIVLIVATVAGVCNGQKGDVVAAGAQVKKLAGDFKFTEGPAADAKGDVYFSDIPNNRILKWSVEDGKLSTFLENSGGANGLYFDKDGNLIACQGGDRRLVSISPKGEVTVLADKYEGKKFNSLNDLWIDPKGGIYFSDPRYGGREGMEQDGEHVYYLTPDRKSVTRVINDMVRPNGVIGTPNGRRLFVADHGAGKTYVYRVNKDGTLTDKQLFAPEGSDGVTIDSRGNVYLTGKGVAVYNRKGQKVQEIAVPEGPANVTFGGKDNRTLFITARTSLYSILMEVKGAATPVRPDGQEAQKAKATRESKKAKEGRKKKRQEQ
jgi:gluconolactonase